MTRVVLVASSPRFALLLPPQTWRALDAARPVYVLDDQHPSLPALDVAEIAWEVLQPADDTGPAGRDLLMVGQGAGFDGVAEARRWADALLTHAKERGEATLLLPPERDPPPPAPAPEGAPPAPPRRASTTGLLVQLISDRAARQHIEVEAVYPLGEPRGSALLDLVALQERLRGPGGCPWDAEQNHASLARNLVEETYEVLDAIDDGDPEHLREELGDLLLQVVFHAQIAADGARFDVDDVSRGIVDKLVRRHPHVFGEVELETAAAVKANWDRIKREEEGRPGPFAGIPGSLPALQLAAKVQKRAADEGFAWPDGAVGPVQNAGRPRHPAAKVREELDETLAATSDAERESELGDLLLAVVSLARQLRVDPEAALRRAAGRYRDRFTAARQLAIDEGNQPASLDLDAWLAYWERAKAAEREPAGD